MTSVNRDASWAIATKGGRVTSKAKAKTAYVCNECGADYNKWQGQCSECQTWNSVVEMRLGTTARNRSARFEGYAGSAGGNPVPTLADISLGDLTRFGSGAGEVDRVLGGGLVPGSVVLLGGSPGGGGNPVRTLADIRLAYLPRFGSGAGEFDRVLGGGFVPGSVVLIGGSPGAGKSTLLLQTLRKLAQSMSALYVPG